MAAWFRTRTCDEIMRLFDAAHVVAGPVLTIADIVQDPHYAARARHRRRAGRRLRRRCACRAWCRASPPRQARCVHAGRGLGADNRAIYLDRIGLDEAELAQLVEAGVI